MDLLTHTAVGLFLGRAGLKSWTPRAMPILLLAANAPDIDIVTAAGGSLRYLEYHRHLTHSLAAMPVMAILPALAVRLAGRKPIHWTGAFAASLIAVATHLLLDWTNAYGIRIFLPFSSRWMSLDATSVIDLWIWAACLLGVAAPFLSRLVSAEIASARRRTPAYGRVPAVLALVFLVLYTGGRGALHARASEVLEARLYEGAEPLRAAALPDPVNPLRWRGVVETDELFAVQDVDLAGEFDPTRATLFRKPSPSPALEAARRAPTIQGFLKFAQWPLWRETAAPEPDNARLVEVFDLRFGTPAEPGFAATALLDERLRVLRESFQFGRLRPR